MRALLTHFLSHSSMEDSLKILQANVNKGRIALENVIQAAKNLSVDIIIISEPPIDKHTGSILSTIIFKVRLNGGKPAKGYKAAFGMEGGINDGHHKFSGERVES